MDQIQLQDEYSKTTRHIKVTVLPEYVEERSNPARNLYAYSYMVELENMGRETVQLVNRHWRVYSGGNQIADIKGEGVIGEQPVLEPGMKYQYTSWTMVNDPMGSMKGFYTFMSDQSEWFDVEIPEFFLIYIDTGAIH